jgi:flagellar biosynthetic protein FliR
VNPEAVAIPLLVFARVATVVTVLPPFSTHAVPKRLRMLLSLAVTALLLPVIPASAAPAGLALLGAGVVREVAVGLLAAATVRAAMAGVQIAAEIASAQAGFGVAALLDPVLPSTEGPIATLSSVLATAAFVSAGLHGRCLVALSDSFFLCPPGSAFPGGQGLFAAASASFSLGVQLAGPVIAVVFVLNSCVAMLARLAPRMNAFLSVGLALLGAAGLVMAGLSLPWWIGLDLSAATSGVEHFGAAWGTR